MRLRSVLASLLVVVLVGCGNAATEASPETRDATSATGEEPSPTGDRPTRQEETPVPPVPETLDFTATTVAGESFEGASLAGRPTLLWFWAPWCPTCRSQIPEVQGYAEDHAGELTVVGVGSLDSAEAIADFADEVDGVTHLEDTDGALYRRFGIAEQSSFVLLDESGAVAFETGYGGSEELAAEVADVVG